MSKDYLYRQIAETIRSQIMQGELRPGDRLPSVREMTARWDCTVGTVQHAYQELVRQGLVTSRAGQGTHVAAKPPQHSETPMRRATLIHRAESFLLEVLTAGYAPAEVEEAVRQALDRWRVVIQQDAPPGGPELRFSGSHDLAVAWIGSHFGEIAPGYSLQLGFTGSLGGLIALAEGKADLAGCHLWDEETDTYNAPFVRRLLPGRRVALLTLAHRRVGFILLPGNPAQVQTLSGLLSPGLRFVNRQSGSGTRVWLDAALRRADIPPHAILGYDDEKMTHSDVALAVAEGRADVGLGLEAAAHPYGLDFVPLLQERYDLVIPEENLDLPPVEALAAWLPGKAAQQAISVLAGYDVSATGKLVWMA
jgi:putative molybdopterin biosynthesis protein